MASITFAKRTYGHSILGPTPELLNPWAWGLEPGIPKALTSDTATAAGLGHSSQSTILGVVPFPFFSF